MNQVKVMDKIEGIKDLLGHFLEPWHVEIMFLFDLSVVLGVFIEVVSKELSHDKEMLLVVKIVDHLQEVFGIKVLAVG